VKFRKDDFMYDGVFETETLEIHDAPGAKMNTKTCVVVGQRDIDGRTFQVPIQLMFTSEKCGETLSLIDKAAGVILTVPFEALIDLIKETRRVRRIREGE
jgi:hypothetical protein